MEDDEQPQLSAETFSALAEFYSEQNAREEQQEAARTLAEAGADIDWKEDWQLSQFWYSEETAVSLARAVMDSLAGVEGTVCRAALRTARRLLTKLPGSCREQVCCMY